MDDDEHYDQEPTYGKSSTQLTRLEEERKDTMREKHTFARQTYEEARMDAREYSSGQESIAS